MEARWGNLFKCILPLDKLGLEPPKPSDLEQVEEQEHTFETFSGSGHVLGAERESSKHEACFASQQFEDPNARRKLLQEAVEKRWQKKQTEEYSDL